MFRKGTLLITVLSVICTALFGGWVHSMFNHEVITFCATSSYFALFFATFTIIHNIIEKKVSKFWLVVVLSAIIAVTFLFKGFYNIQNGGNDSTIKESVVIMIAFICFSVFTLYNPTRAKR